MEWTHEQVAFLMARWGQMSDIRLAEALGRSETSVLVKRYKMGLNRHNLSAARYADCAARGLTKAQTARELRVSRQAVGRAASTYGLNFNKGKSGRPGVADDLTPAERGDFEFLVYRQRYRRADALRAIGRADLVAANG